MPESRPVPAPIRLGFNVDHVATLRNARGGPIPDPVRAAQQAVEAGADGITAHLREDRRHIRDEDIRRLRGEVVAPLNLEMAATDEMAAIALRTAPHACCLVPERRQEVTTEGGLDVAGQVAALGPFVAPLVDSGIRVSMFIDPDLAQIDASSQIGAQVVELHTGAYCQAQPGPARDRELARIVAAALHAAQDGLECHAGHGLTFETVSPIAALPQIVELNIGHFLVGEAVFMGISGAIQHMRALMTAARQGGGG